MGPMGGLNALYNIKISLTYCKSSHGQIFRAVEGIKQKLILILNFKGKKFRLDSWYSGQYSNSRPGRRRNQSEINFKFHLKKKIQAGQSVFRPIFEMKTY